jgi:serine/threonine-protein kinase
VVQTLEVAVEGEEYYLALEFLDGQPLHRIQRRAERAGKRVPQTLEYLIVMDALSGLDHAHELADYDGSPLGIVHRDVTPQNIFVTYDGLVKVVDFGIAKAAGRAGETKQGVVKGKVRYMSPEQAMSLSVDRRSDVFAAGILLWEAATGARFWQDRDELGILRSLAAGDFDPSPRAVDPTVPFEIDAICRRAMSDSPDDRYATAAEMRAELETFLADELIGLRRRLGPVVAEMFAKERKEVRSIIERANRDAQMADSLTMTQAPTSAGSARLRLSGAIPSLAPTVAAPSVAPAPEVVVAPAAPPYTRQLRRGLVGAAAVAILVLVGRDASRVTSLGASAHARSRESAVVASERVGFEVSSRGRRLPVGVVVASALGGSAVLARTVPPAAAQAPVRHTAAAPGHLASPAATGTASASARPSDPSALPDSTRRRTRPAIDTADPWSVPSAATTGRPPQKESGS